MKEVNVGLLADLAARHKLVPFMGAGCSVPQLGLDWNSLIREIADQVASGSDGHLAIAQDFIDERGRASLATFLALRLTIKKFRDASGGAHLAMMSLGVGVIYTTNQDNVFERAIEKYGRIWRKVVLLEDLAQYQPGERIYIKYHGDLEHPETLVYGQDDYDRRVDDPSHFLNIRLRSDLLAKHLLFVGYSFRDQTIRSTFRELRAAFNDKLPTAYMIAFRYSAELQAVCDEFGVTLIDPCVEFPDAADCAEAFERYLTALVNETYDRKQAADVATLPDCGSPITERVLTNFELTAMEQTLADEPVVDAAQKFRAVMDLTVIPIDFQRRVVALVEQMADRCQDREESDEIRGVLFNLHLTDVECCLLALTAVFATANVRSRSHQWDYFQPIIQDGAFEEITIVFAAVAIERLTTRGQEITEAFRWHVGQWFDVGTPFDALHEDYQAYVNHWIGIAWSGRTTLENPIKSQRRLKRLPRCRMTYKEIYRGVLDMFVKNFDMPKED